MSMRLAFPSKPEWYDAFSSIDWCHRAHIVAWAVRALCGIPVNPPRYVMHRFEHGNGRTYRLDGCDRIYLMSPSRMRTTYGTTACPNCNATVIGERWASTWECACGERIEMEVP